MTTAIALNGPWDGLRAFPRDFRAAEPRMRLEAALGRLEHHHHRFARHAARVGAALDRIDRLRAGMIDELDAIDADPDLECDVGSYDGSGREFDVCDNGEPGVDDEPSLCGIHAGGQVLDPYDREGSDLSWGGEYASTDQRHLTRSIEGDDDVDLEPSLSAVLPSADGDQTGMRWLGNLMANDAEAQCEDEGAPEDHA